MPPIPSRTLRRAAQGGAACDTIELTYDARFLRRRVLTTTGGTRILVDLAQTTSLDHGDALGLEDGRFVQIIAAQEDLLEVTGPVLPRIAWHVGNRHTPCQIEPNRMLIQRDHVIRNMLKLIGATTREVSEPFHPEGGAYGHGRTHGHDHGHVHGQGQGQGDDHDHDHHHHHDQDRPHQDHDHAQ